jgi:hypothetical protein
MGLGLNRFTGLRVTPTELAWLIRQHQRLQSAIRRAAEAAEASGRARDARTLESLQDQLRCVEVVIRLHPAGFDPKGIPTVRHHAPRLYNYGVLSRAIRNLLRRRNGKPMSTAHIARTIAKERNLVLDAEMRVRNHKTVLKQLNALQKLGSVEVLPCDRPDGERYWRLKPKRD